MKIRIHFYKIAKQQGGIWSGSNFTNRTNVQLIK